MYLKNIFRRILFIGLYPPPCILGGYQINLLIGLWAIAPLLGTETLVEWIQRARGIAEATARSCRVSNWVESQRLKMWQWAGHVARRDDGRWSKKVLLWEPTDGQRPRGHPPRRWADRLDQYVNEQMGLHKGEWMMLPDDRKGWSSWADGFKKFE